MAKIAAELPIWCPVFNSHVLSCSAFVSGVYRLFMLKLDQHLLLMPQLHCGHYTLAVYLTKSSVPAFKDGF